MGLATASGPLEYVVENLEKCSKKRRRQRHQYIYIDEI